MFKHKLNDTVLHDCFGGSIWITFRAWVTCPTFVA